MNRRGQILVFYGLLVPLIFLFLGAVFDFGWWFFNQSRLQNAADAAAKQLVFDEKNLSDYTYTTYHDRVDPSLLGDNPIISARNTYDGDSVAEEYIKKNLADGKGLGTRRKHQTDVCSARFCRRTR